MENLNKKPGGFLGFLKGTQPLSYAFWGVGVIPALIIFLVMLMVLQSHKYDFSTYISISFFVVGVHRFFAWISIIRCRKNTDNAIWGTLGIVIVVVDILYKLLFGAMYTYKMFGSENNKQKAIETIDSCKQKISQLYNIPVEELEGNDFLSYSGSERYYGIKYGDKRFKCFVYPDSIVINKNDYQKNKDKTLEELIKDRIKEKKDSLNK
ncbi:hypothetical protein U6A24_13420 [Aquimarina gracilis]|uniref:PH (Pleckstrin Homology) domain-containing protein n=1 Tax=Aquimarina gracilis TaxID=874422 RepID=A0ABU5ZX79_9FLAO|nr:hypothetical protein [Aquimarina gracilis]MEB3346471.1 hypothetical protein [Aquimarina gracilis]